MHSVAIFILLHSYQLGFTRLRNLNVTIQKNQHPILKLLVQSKPEQDWILVALHGAVSREGSYGQFIKLTFQSETDEELTATCDRVHFDLLFPYIERLTAKKSIRNGIGTGEEVLIPVFCMDKSKKWKFSNVGAQILLNEENNPISKTEQLLLVEIQKNYEFRLKSNTKEKAEIQAIAKMKGMSLNKFLAFIIKREIQNNALKKESI